MSMEEVNYFDLTKRITIPNDEQRRTTLVFGHLSASLRRAAGRGFLDHIYSTSFRDGVRLYKVVMPDVPKRESEIFKNPWVRNNMEIYEELLGKGYSPAQAERLVHTLGVAKCAILTYLSNGITDEEMSKYNELMHNLFSE